MVAIVHQSATASETKITIMTNSSITKTLLAASLLGGIALSASAQSRMILSENWDDNGGVSKNWKFSKPRPIAAVNDFAGDQMWLFSGSNGGQGTWKNAFSGAPSTNESLVLSLDFYYPGTAGDDSIAMVGIAGSGFSFDMGFSNGTSSGDGLAVQILGFAGGDGWLTGVSYATLGATSGWISATATITDESVGVVFADSRSGGFGTQTLSSSGAGPTGAFTQLTIGAPQGMPGTATGNGSGARIDNISFSGLEVIPEPGTYAAIFGGLALLGAFVYRRRLSAKK